MKFFAKILCLSMLAAAAACSNDDEDGLILLVRCSDKAPRSGDVVGFDIESFISDGTAVAEVRVASFDSENGTREIETLKAGVSRFEYRYEYKIPTFKEKNAQLEMRFAAVAAGGASQNAVVKLTVSAAQLPAEYTGITLWSPASGRADGYSIAAKSTLFTSESSDDDVDLYIPWGSDAETLERTLRSKTGLRFVKANSFDYGSATAASLNETFANSTKSNAAVDLAQGDLIVIGRDDAALGVVRIESIADYDGSTSDCITLSLKLIE